MLQTVSNNLPSNHCPDGNGSKQLNVGNEDATPKVVGTM